jgi:hypothetical protein
MKLPIIGHRSEQPRGQGLVEFALILPLLVLLLVMAIDFGRVFFGMVALQNASRIGADFGASHADAWNGAPSGEEQAEQDHYQNLVLGDMQSLNCELPTPDPVPDPVFSGFDDGDLAYVELACEFGLLTPLAETLLGGRVQLAARSDFAVNRTINPNLPESSVPPPNLCSAPNASFDTQPAAGAGNRVNVSSGTEVLFDDTSTVEAGCPVLTWSWDFDDGAPTTDADTSSTSHVFTHSGGGSTDYRVRLLVTNAGGTSTAQVTVRAQ